MLLKFEIYLKFYKKINREKQMIYDGIERGRIMYEHETTYSS